MVASLFLNFPVPILVAMSFFFCPFALCDTAYIPKVKIKKNRKKEKKETWEKPWIRAGVHDFCIRGVGVQACHTRGRSCRDLGETLERLDILAGLGKPQCPSPKVGSGSQGVSAYTDIHLLLGIQVWV